MKGMVIYMKNRRSCTGHVMNIYMHVRNFQKLTAETNISAHASGTAFFIFLSLIPMMMILCGLLPHATFWQNNQVNISQAVIPEKVYVFLLGLASNYQGNPMTLLSVSAVVAIWSASKGILAIIRGLNHVYHIEESRNYVLLRLKAFFYTIFLLAAIILSIGVIGMGNQLIDLLCSLGEDYFPIWKWFRIIRHILVAFMISVVFCVMYCFLPNNHLTWREHYTGAVFTAVFWTVYSFFFSIYIDYMGGFSMYGSLTTVVIVMIWLYFCMYIFFCGALVNRYLNDNVNCL